MPRTHTVDRRLRGAEPGPVELGVAAPAAFAHDRRSARLAWPDPFAPWHDGVHVSDDEDLMRLHAQLSAGPRAEAVPADAAAD